MSTIAPLLLEKIVFETRSVEIAKKNAPQELEKRTHVVIRIASIVSAALFAGVVAAACKVIVASSLALLSAGLVFAISYCVFSKLFQRWEQTDQTFSSGTARNIVDKLVRAERTKALRELPLDSKGSLPKNWSEITREKALNRVLNTLKN